MLREAMFHSRTLIRLTAMGLLAAGPTTAALVAPSAVPSPPDVGREPASAPLRASGEKHPRGLQPVLLASRPAVARVATKTAPGVVSAPAPARPVVRPLDEKTQEKHSASWLVHRVRDGDSLEQLAAKYLGSPDRAEEILIWNCDRIDDPAMLPLGVELLIPARGQ